MHFPTASGEFTTEFQRQAYFRNTTSRSMSLRPLPTGDTGCIPELSSAQLRHTKAWYKRYTPNAVMRRYSVPVFETFEETKAEGREHTGYPDCRHWKAGGVVLRRQATKLATLIRNYTRPYLNMSAPRGRHMDPPFAVLEPASGTWKPFAILGRPGPK